MTGESFSSPEVLGVHIRHVEAEDVDNDFAVCQCQSLLAFVALSNGFFANDRPISTHFVSIRAFRS